MAKLMPEVMFRRHDWPGYSDVELAAFEFELMDRLGSLEPGSALYMEQARAFHREVAKRPKAGRPSTL